MVGCERSNESEISQTHASPPEWLATMLSSRSRTGSPNALNIRARSPAQSVVKGSRIKGEQHSPLVTSSTARLCFDMRLY